MPQEAFIPFCSSVPFDAYLAMILVDSFSEEKNRKKTTFTNHGGKIHIHIRRQTTTYNLLILKKKNVKTAWKVNNITNNKN